jgi:hypothetical protein
VKAAIVAPILGTVLPVVGVRVVDYLFPQPAPRLDAAACSRSGERLGMLEAKVEMLVRLFADRGAEASDEETVPWTQLRQDFFESVSPKPAERKDRLIAVENTSVYIGRKAYIGQRAWDWTIYVTADDRVLEDVKCVIYTLHPTFPNRVWRVCERGVADNAFPLTLRGWGTFIVDVLITFKDGSEQRRKHQLVFVPGE